MVLIILSLAIGFVRKESQPAAMILSLASVRAWAVRATITHGLVDVLLSHVRIWRVDS